MTRPKTKGAGPRERAGTRDEQQHANNGRQSPPLQGLFIKAESERIVWGSLIEQPALQAQFAAEIDGESFATAEGKAVFGALCSCNDAGHPLHADAVVRHLDEAGLLDAVEFGAMGVLAHSSTGYPASVVQYHIEQLQEARARREMHAALSKLGQNLESFLDPAATIAAAQEELARVGEILKGGGGLLDVLAPLRFDVANPPPPAVPIFTLACATIATPGNLVGVQAQAKAGKTALAGAMFAAAMDPAGDCLGVTSANPNGRALIHLDTEQSDRDHHDCVAIALRRAGRGAAPPWFYSYRVAVLPLQTRRKLLALELARAQKEHGGIHSLFLDGLADFVADPNDPEEAFAFIAELHQLAIQYATAIVCIIHENPGGGELGKTRGHLGSQLERKAETNLRLQKDGDIVTVFTERARHAHVPKDRGPRFQWCDDAKMHVSTENRAESKAGSKRADQEEFAAEVFSDTPASVGLTHSQVIERIQELAGITWEGARSRQKTLAKSGIIKPRGEKWFLS